MSTNFFFFKVNNMKYWHPHLPFGQHISVSTLVVNTKNGHQKHTEHMLRALAYDWTVIYEWKDSLHYISLHLGWGPSWSWSYGSWIYNYLWNQCLSPLKLWVRTPFMARCTRYNIMWHSISVTSDRSVVFSWYSSFLHQ